MTIAIRPFDVNHISVKFFGNFSKKVLDAVKTVPDRKWNNEFNAWILPDTKQTSDILLENLYQTGEFSNNDSDSEKSTSPQTEKSLSRMIYIHVLNRGAGGVISPLDRL